MMLRCLAGVICQNILISAQNRIANRLQVHNDITKFEVGKSHTLRKWNLEKIFNLMISAFD